MSYLAGVLLAAGAGRRFGDNKLLHPLADGTPLLLRAATTLQSVLPSCYVVVDPQDKEAIALLRGTRVRLVGNSRAAEGMGTSIARGVNAAAGAAGWVIALADMPALQEHTITTVAEQLIGERTIVAPCYQGRRGHPVGFARGWRRELSALGGDGGARSILAANPHHLVTFECNDPGVLLDIDRPEDLQQL